MRQIVFVLLPATAAILVLSEPMIRIVFERGEFGPKDTELVATALFWFAFSLPTNGMFLLLSRTFFGLQQPWIPTAIAGGNLAITAIASFFLYKPFGVAGHRRGHRDRHHHIGDRPGGSPETAHRRNRSARRSSSRR